MKKALAIVLVMAISAVFSVAQEKAPKPLQKKAKSTECCDEMKDCSKGCAEGASEVKKEKPSGSKSEKGTKVAKKTGKPEAKKPS